MAGQYSRFEKNIIAHGSVALRQDASIELNQQDNEIETEGLLSYSIQDDTKSHIRFKMQSSSDHRF